MTDLHDPTDAVPVDADGFDDDEPEFRPRARRRAHALTFALGASRQRARRECEAGQFLPQAVVQFLPDAALLAGDGIDEGSAERPAFGDVAGEHQQAGETLPALHNAEFGRLLDRVDGVAAGIRQADDLGLG